MTKPQGQRSVIPWLFVLFFIVMVGAMGGFIYLSKIHYSGVVTENAYDEGLEYNKLLEERRQQNTLGWQVKLKFKGDIKGKLVLTLKDREGKPIKDADIMVLVMRPVTDRYDFQVKLVETKRSGQYQAPIEFPKLGQWQLYVTINAGKEKYIHKERVVLK
jgi:nitrogen fixation protein FixH